MGEQGGRMAVRKAVIPVAGLGTRFLPVTKAIPKELIPIVDRPMLQYVVEEAVSAGIDQVIFVTARGKTAIEDYFDRSPELERLLEEKGDQGMLQELRRIAGLARFSYVRQGEPLGLGHAVLTAREAVGDEPFAVFLPDDIITSEVPVISQMLSISERYGGASVVAVEEVPWEEVRSYGVVRPVQVDERVYRVEGLVEKPEPEEAPSNLAIVGRYILHPRIFQALERTPPGVKGEIQITDGLALLLQEQPIYALRFEGTRYDTGTPLGLLRASIELALGSPGLGPRVEEFLRTLLNRYTLRLEG